METGILENKYATEAAMVIVGNTDGSNSLDQVKRKRIAIIDGLNVAYSKNDKRARLSNILAVEKTLKKTFDSVEIIVDASARHKIDDSNALEALIRKNKIFMCPANIDGDDLIWVRSATLAEHGASVWIVTNDRFPVAKSEKSGIFVRNLTTTIWPSGEIYILERNIKYIEVIDSSTPDIEEAPTRIVLTENNGSE